MELFERLQLHALVLIPVGGHEIGPPVGGRDVVIQQIFEFLCLRIRHGVAVRIALGIGVVPLVVFTPGGAAPTGHKHVGQLDNAEGEEH